MALVVVRPSTPAPLLHSTCPPCWQLCRRHSGCTCGCLCSSRVVVLAIVVAICVVCAAVVTLPWPRLAPAAVGNMPN